MSKLNAKPNIYIFGLLNYFILYLASIVGSVALFFILFYRIDRAIEIIPISLLLLVLVLSFGYAAWMYLKVLLIC